jgi:hypothetical protein
MKGGDIVVSIFTLILVYLLVVNWKGANALLGTSAVAASGLIRTLQGR